MSLDTLLSKIWLIPSIIIAFTVHEYAHAKVADMLGDKLPRYQGRLTLNPLKHIDVFGMLMILILGMGWARPVETNPRAYKNYYNDQIKVSAAGCVANIITAVIFAILYKVLINTNMLAMLPIAMRTVVVSILIYTVQINVILAIFNFMPIPGLDGFKIFSIVFRDSFSRLPDLMYRYQTFIFVLFIMSPLSSILVDYPARIIYTFLLR